MKRNVLLVLLILTALQLTAIWQDIPANSGKQLFEHRSFGKSMTEVDFNLDGYELEEIIESGQVFHKLTYQNEGSFVEIGKPDLPTFNRLLAIPSEGVPNIQIIDIEEEIIHDIVIYPRQELAIESQPNRFEFVIDDNYYSKGAIFPSQISTLGEPAIMRGLRVVNLIVNPFRYDPQTRSLSILKNIKVVVNTSGRGGLNTLQRETKLSRFFEPLYQATVLNYESTRSRDDLYQDPSYLFIHTNDIQVANDLAYLTEWKRQKGFDVSIHSVNSGTSFNTIKSYIQDAYNNWLNPPEFICLVGDAEGSYNIPVDPANNGDHGYVRLDGTDMLADAHIGRLSFSSVSELQTIIYKILNYEKQPFLGQTDWYTHSLLVGDPSSSGPSTIDVNQFIKEIMLQHNSSYQFTEAYYGSYSSIMSNTINSGVTYFNYRGYLGMSGFGNSNINSLNNGLMLPVAVFLTCGTGTFYSGTSRSEAFLRAGTPGNAKGAIAAIGTATSSTHTMFNNCVDSGIFYGLFAEKNFNMGSALTRGKLNLYTSFYQQPNYVSNFSYWNNLMGDPAMELWSGVPQNFVVNYDANVALGANNLLVTVANDFGAPIENAWVTALMGDDDIFATGWTNENGEIILPIDAQDAGTASLTVTKHNYIPHTGSFDVGEADRFVNVLEYVIDDDNLGDSSGNDDGIVNPGETIELLLRLKNFGTSTATGVEATINTNNDFITITDDEETYGDIMPGTSAFCNEDYDFSLDASALGGMEILLSVNITDNNGDLWSDFVSIPIAGANLFVNDFAFPNEPGGILEPGATGDLEITIENPGTVAANNIYGVLSSDNSWITIDDDEAYFGNVAAGGQVTCSTDMFEITAAAMTIPGSQYTLEMQLYNSDGYDHVVSFLITVGEAEITDPLGPDGYGYYCYDDGDIDYYNVPVYEWIDTSGGTQLNMNDTGDGGAIQDIDNLPITFRYYGEEYNSLTVCSNGWITPGNTDAKDYMNWQIPGAGGPSPQIAVFWDDLKTGNVEYLYDSAMNYIVITWDMLNDYNNDPEVFQAIIYDANYYPTATGDSEIKFQYQVFNNTNVGSYGYPYNHGLYSTIGLEDHTGTRGLQYTFNNVYPTQAKIPTNESALLFTGPPIQFQEPYLVLGGVTLFDPNGNGQADFGETIDVEVMLNNMGQSAATGVSAVITSSDPYITITQNSSNYNNIAGNVSGTNITPFTVEIAEDCPDGHVAPFMIDVTSNEDNWQLNFTMELNAPIVEFHSVFVDDGANNILDPGETADIYVSFINNGGAPATNVLTVLSESDPYISLNSTQHNFAILNAGNVSTGMFNVSASSNAPIGHLAQIDWDMNGDTNYTADGTFDLVVSQVPVLLNEDFSGGAYPPNGWSLSGQNTGNWSLSSTDNAGGSSPESKLSWSPSFNGDSRLVSPVLNTAGSSSLDFEFRHYLNDFSGNGYTLSVRTTSDGGNTWNIGWEINPNGNVGPELVQTSISTPDVGSQNFQIAMYFSGNSYNINYWYIDDIHLEGGQGTALGFIEGTVSLTGGAGNVEDVIVTAGDFVTSPDASGYYLIPLPAGMYDVTAELDGYSTGSQNNVSVTTGQVSTVDFILTALDAPQNLVANVNTNDVTLTWEMPVDEGIRTMRTTIPQKIRNRNDFLSAEKNISAIDLSRDLTGFRVYRNSSMIAEIDDAGIMTYLDEFLNAGDYSYYVTAVYDDDLESDPSNTEMVNIELLPPADLLATVAAPNIELNWTAPVYSRSLTGYNVYRDGQQIAEVTENSYIDEDLMNGIYSYFVKALYGQYESEASNEVTIELTDASHNLIYQETALMGNYPNPFNPVTEISFVLKDQQNVRLEIFNVRGQKVKTLVNDQFESGLHKIVWEGLDDQQKQVSSGIYFYKMQAGNYLSTKKMIMMK